MSHSSRSQTHQALIGVGVLIVGGLLAWGASGLPEGVGYSGVGPAVLPWFISGALMLCGVLLLLQALRGGYRDLEDGSGAAHGNWHALAWIAAGILLNATLVERAGFILSCALCFVLAVRGLRLSEGKPGGGVRQVLIDAFTGFAIAAPAFWLFTKVLAINLPGLTQSGWI
ncbi:tripartite tricarboxylate transporter TctB family protein [Piscinibacter sakaiensis]|uniref:tripartite tricarboxylate transporter TctB family protein n=1 Tax=Piscinibacter sakaiensis TaxID=1547922 RepID=UPI003AAA5AD2